MVHPDYAVVWATQPLPHTDRPKTTQDIVNIDDMEDAGARTSSSRPNVTCGFLVGDDQSA